MERDPSRLAREDHSLPKRCVVDDEYIAVINLDYSQPQDNNAYQKIIAALIQAGWDYAETSALTYNGPDLGPVLVALDLLARALPTGGIPSAMTIQLQRIGEMKDYAAAKNHPNALSDCRAMPRPDPN